MLAKICSLQKQYGKTKDEFNTLVDGFEWVLRDYETPEIRVAFGDYIKENSDIPAPADIVNLITKERISNRNQNPQPNQLQVWEDRRNSQKKLVDDYVATFRSTSGIWREAERDGWELPLFRFIHSMADVHAQIIVGCKGIGWNGVDIFGAAHKYKEGEIYRWMQDQRREAAKGYIDFGIPTGQIERMKGESLGSL